MMTDGPKCQRSDLISSNLVDATSTVSAAILTTILRSLVEKESLPEAALVSLLQDVNTHNCADYFRQILVDVAEDLQEQTISRAEELTSLTKAAESTRPSSSSAQRPASILRACLVSGRVRQVETDPDQCIVLSGIRLSRCARCLPPCGFVEAFRHRIDRRSTPAWLTGKTKTDEPFLSSKEIYPNTGVFRRLGTTGGLVRRFLSYRCRIIWAESIGRIGIRKKSTCANTVAQNRDNHRILRSQPR